MAGDGNGTGRVGAVVIGRNESDRLADCLASVQAQTPWCVYVDSGSTDNSVSIAHQHGVIVHELDPSRSFSAARARNEGAQILLSLGQQLSAIQFVDGDCELQEAWMAAAYMLLSSDCRIGIVCGRLEERHPGRTVFQRMLEMEWDTPAGWVGECGGLFLIRSEAFQQIGGFREELIAGEEPELCLRLRMLGYSIRKSTQLMARHDAGPMRAGEWWKRCARNGRAITCGMLLHGRSSWRFRVRQVSSVLFWTLALPCAVSVLVIDSPLLGIALASLYALLWLRILQSRKRVGASWSDAAFYASLVIVGKFAELSGVVRELRAGLGQRSRKSAAQRSHSMDSEQAVLSRI